MRLVHASPFQVGEDRLRQVVRTRREEAVIGAVGQAEREAMLERQREGIAMTLREGAL
jgi:hypothetical protein